MIAVQDPSYLPTEDRVPGPAQVLHEIDLQYSGQRLSTGFYQGDKGPWDCAKLELALPWLNTDCKSARKATPRLSSPFFSLLILGAFRVVFLNLEGF